MKLNFWQWLGVILFIVGVIYYVWEKNATPSNPAPSSPAPTTQPH